MPMSQFAKGQSALRRYHSQSAGLALARPEQAETLTMLRATLIFLQVLAQEILKSFPVDAAIGKGLGQYLSQLFQAVLGERLGAMQLLNGHGVSPKSPGSTRRNPGSHRDWP
jgi:hypothetical protein